MIPLFSFITVINHRTRFDFESGRDYKYIGDAQKGIEQLIELLQWGNEFQAIKK